MDNVVIIKIDGVEYEQIGFVIQDVVSQRHRAFPSGKRQKAHIPKRRSDFVDISARDNDCGTDGVFGFVAQKYCGPIRTFDVGVVRNANDGAFLVYGVDVFHAIRRKRHAVFAIFAY